MNTSKTAILDYLAAVDEEASRREKATEHLSKLYRRAARVKMPKNLRPATAEDCATVGNIIWHNDFDEGATKWSIVDSPLHYGDAFKAYVSDGCRYGLEGAFVEIMPVEKDTK